MLPQHNRSLRAFWLGRRAYLPTLELQKRVHALRQAGEVPDTLLLLEHNHVLTLGRGGHESNIVASADALLAKGVEVLRTDRGGDVTYHGPGQLVAYPIVNLAPDRCDVRKYVGVLQQVMIRYAASFGVEAGVLTKYPGVWLDRTSPGCWLGEDRAVSPLKLGAVGVRISSWVTMHGFALNLCPDLSLFDLIVPCGIKQYGVTSLAQFAPEVPSPEHAATSIAQLFADQMGAHLESVESLSGGDPYASPSDAG